MSTNDKALVGMAVAAVILAVIAFTVASRQAAPDYVTEDGSPEAVVHNYLTALRLADHEKAYSYLSREIDGYPKDLETFIEDMTLQRWQFPVEDTATSFEVETEELTGNLAVVAVEETRFVERGLFDSAQLTEDFVMTLRLVDGNWRLTHGERYWTVCWDDPDSNRCRRESGDRVDEETGDEARNDGPDEGSLEEAP